MVKFQQIEVSNDKSDVKFTFHCKDYINKVKPVTLKKPEKEKKTQKGFLFYILIKL